MARMNFTEDNSVSKTNWLDGFVDALGMSILPGRAVTSTSHGDGRNRERTGLGRPCLNLPGLNTVFEHQLDERLFGVCPNQLFGFSNGK